MAKVARENRVPIMMSAEELTAIDEWRFRNHVATRSDAIRRLCQNALAVDGEIDSLVDQGEQLLDEVSEEVTVSWEIMMQILGRHAVASPPLPERDWKAIEVLDVFQKWIADFFDRVHVHYLDVLKLNNRIFHITHAGSLRRGKLAAMRSGEEIDRLRADVFAKREEADHNRHLMTVVARLEGNPTTKDHYEAMTEDEKEAYLGKWTSDLSFLMDRIVSDPEHVAEHKRNRPPLEDVANAVVHMVMKTPGLPVEYYLAHINEQFDRRIEPLSVARMIRQALEAEAQLKGNDDVSS